MRQPVTQAELPDHPGVYVLWTDGERPLYVGVAATQSLRSRWRGQHLRPRAGGSALRRTLGVHLGLVETKLRVSEGRYYPPDVEEGITAFLAECEIEFFVTNDAFGANALEARLIAELEPILNVRRPQAR